MEQHAVVPINYLRQVADQLTDFGIDIGAWLSLGGLQEADLSNAAVSVSVEAFGLLMDEGILAACEPGLGLFVGRRLVPSTHGVVGMAALASATIREAMQISEQFVRLRTGVVALHTHVNGDMFEVHCEPALGLVGSGTHAVVEATVVALKNVADDKTLHRSVCSSVSFAFPAPGHAALARDILGCEVRYDQAWSGLSFPLAVAEQTVSQHDALVLAEALRICDAELRKLDAGTTIAARLERLLFERKPSFPALELSARMLGVAPRTLHRRLTEEGTSYRDVLESVKHRIARECLNVERMRVKEVAYLLGYNDVANFRRAFKRWEGLPPSAIGGRATR